MLDAAQEEEAADRRQTSEAGMVRWSSGFERGAARRAATWPEGALQGRRAWFCYFLPARCGCVGCVGGEATVVGSVFFGAGERLPLVSGGASRAARTKIRQSSGAVVEVRAASLALLSSG
ncbi:uncharacterized protein A4U43_C02F9390 [Asparagus officinalis]|uniref:Uncharacterized protein n=1 Tax=Asparagus officinalis TaxID=4686 RepID=A0A5P1FHV6_ASPOF|nr:uncharacterized protein A4U43_C02F9390 [Asparagus officinalis]